MTHSLLPGTDVRLPSRPPLRSRRPPREKHVQNIFMLYSRYLHDGRGDRGRDFDYLAKRRDRIEVPNPIEKESPTMEPTAQFEEIMIPLTERIHGCDSVRGVLGVPEWWPTGDRVAVVFAHGGASNFEDPLLVLLCRVLTEKGYLTLRFNFPFAEAAKRSSADSSEVLERGYRAALNALGRDPTALPARLFVGGVGLGSRVAAGLVSDRLHADGLFLLGFPLHPQDKPEKADPDILFRATTPMLFVQGTRDRRCSASALRSALRRVGAPIEVYNVDEADSAFHVPKKSGRTNEQVHVEVLSVLSSWLARRQS
jgi:predicted alpha/beta-hydrolase family hydrolase